MINKKLRKRWEVDFKSLIVKEWQTIYERNKPKKDKSKNFNIKSS